MRNTGSVIFFFLLFNSLLYGQSATIRGIIIDEQTRLALPFVNITVDDKEVVESDSLGNFTTAVIPGYHKMKFSFLSYENVVLHEVKADPIKPVFLEIALKASTNDLDQVTITSGIVNRTSETPLSVRTMGVNEINRMPGATLDVSKLIKNMPGVLPKVSFGYNIIVRGGASHENKFFIDDIEIPSINHFSVQGVAGGPNGLINVDMLRGADLITGAFPADRSNALSSVLNLNTREARQDRLGGKFTLGATDIGLTLEGPISKKTSFIASARKSFSEYYLKVFKLPILPAYTDYNFKLEHKMKKGNLKVIGVGAFDRSRLNIDDASAPDASDRLLYNTGYIPEGDQSVHTLGLNYRRYTDVGFFDLIASSTFFSNKARKYFDNSFEPEDLWIDYNAQEQANKLRFNQTIILGADQFKFGLSLESTNFSIDNYSNEIDPNSLISFVNDYSAQLNALQYGLNISYSKSLLEERLILFAGIRSDASTYGANTRNILDQLSPRLSANYKLSSKSNLSLNVGSYYQLPPSVLLAFSQDDEFVNKERLKYINSRQLAIGYSYQPTEDKIFSIEGFYKKYRDYPYLLRDSISFANANAEYVVVGNQPANSSSEGRAYGLEFFAQKKFRKKSLWTAAYNYSVSEFQDNSGDFISSTWDTRHFMTLAWARTFGKNWQFGAKFTYASPSPYTPFDIGTSSQVTFWDANRRGVFDYGRLNSEYLRPFHQLDLRIDKNYYFDKWSMNLYIDIQNFYSSPIEFIPYLVPQRDENTNFIIDPDDSSRYLMQTINSDTGRVLPTIGIIVEF